MNYLTAEQVLFIHARIIEETGGAHGVRDLGLLESAAARPQATFDGEDLYPDLFTKAAALMHALIQNHPFVDGNKRTGTVAAGLFLEINALPQKSLLRASLPLSRIRLDYYQIWAGYASTCLFSPDCLNTA